MQEHVSKTILLASTSEHKRLATLDALLTLFPTERFRIETLKVSSNVNEQPFGFEETLRGAQNRLEHAKASFQSSYDYVLAIESGVISVAGLYFDTAFCVLEKRSSAERFVIHSMGTPVPALYVEQVKQRGAQIWTIGAIHKELHPTVGDANDINIFVTNGQFPRRRLLSQAVEAVFSLIAPPPKT